MEDIQIHFWRILERDFVTILPSYIKNNFHLRGYKEAVTFKDLGVQQINEIEDYIKTKVSHVLDDVDRRSSCEPIDRSIFFGKYYVADPKNFEFSPGERSLIIDMAIRVKSIVDRNGERNSGIQYFRIDETDKKFRKNIHKGTVNIGILGGRFFASSNDGIVTEHNSENQSVMIADLEKLKLQLSTDVRKWISLKSSQYHASLFEDSMTSVESDDKIIGRITCVFCKISKKKINQIKVSLKYAASNVHWVLSNFDTHVGRCHADYLKNDDETDEIDVMSDRTSDDVELAKRNSKKKTCEKPKKNIRKTKAKRAGKMITTDNIDSIMDECPQIVETASHPTSNSNRQISTEADLEKMIYEQISAQVLGLIQCTFDAKFIRCEVAFLANDETEHTLLAVNIMRDGHCLFRSLAHQLWNGKLSTKEQDESTRNLRAEIVSYIDRNFPSYFWELKGTVYELHGESSDMENESYAMSECKKFLNESLARSAWGGAETIKACSHMHKVNVLVVNEIGNYHYPIGFNANYKKTLIVAYRLSDKDECVGEDDAWESIEGDEEPSVVYCDQIIRNHYDSVIHIEQEVILQMTKYLASIEHRRNNLSNQSIIEINED